jgi:hypothetical protein
MAEMMLTAKNTERTMTGTPSKWRNSLRSGSCRRNVDAAWFR